MRGKQTHTAATAVYFLKPEETCLYPLTSYTDQVSVATRQTNR